MSTTFKSDKIFFRQCDNTCSIQRDFGTHQAALEGEAQKVISSSTYLRIHRGFCKFSLDLLSFFARQAIHNTFEHASLEFLFRKHWDSSAHPARVQAL